MTETKMQLEDWLDDLCVRFIINLPEEDLSSVARICFQVEEAQWFYEDFIRPLDPSLPSMSLRSFCLRIFQHCPLLSAFSADNHMRAFEEFLLYKTRVPVRGAIMLNKAMDSVVLVKGWKKGANWSFPRGKINKDEDDLDCAVREVYEETGYDIKEAGLIPVGDDVKYIEITMREQHMRLYVFRDVPMDTHFEPRTRKEISKIQWYRLSELPAFRKKGQQQLQDGVDAAVNANKFYMVAPFLVPLKRWVVEQKKKEAQRILSRQHVVPNLADEILTEEELGVERKTLLVVPQTQDAERRSALELDTMEGATAALHRLLKIQPPTQGLQPQAASTVQSPASKNSGEALLALLQGKSSVGGLGGTKLILATNKPPDGMHTSATVPETIYHVHSGPQPTLSMSPQASFHTQPFEQSSSFQPPEPEALQDTANHAMFLRIHPSSQPYSPDPRSNQQQQNQAQKLQHPQPLPPQVQRTVFTGDQVHVPLVPKHNNQQPVSQHSGSGFFTIPKSQFSNVHGPMVLPTAIQTPPKLTHHSLALLNAFKTHREDGLLSRDVHGSDRIGQENTSSVVHLQELSADEGQHEKSIHAEEHSSDPSTSFLPAPLAFPIKSVSNDDHRNSLLSMFKTAGGNAESLDPAATITTPADIRHGSEASSSRQLPVNLSLDASSKLTKEAINGRYQPLENNPKPKLPFEPVDIQTHPRQDPVNGPILDESVLMRQDRLLKPYFQSKSSQNVESQSPAAKTELSADPIRGFQPRILKPPQPSQPLIPAELAASPTLSPGLSLSLSNDRRTNQHPDHKKALLSLFRSVPTAPSDQARVEQNPECTSRVVPDDISGLKIGSLASTGGEMDSESSSRRGSHAPISAADKGFLLEYLDAIARGADK